ncbi:MAG: DMT family transporter [Geobacteraceae bacterium]|nr:DMT family transporter [Geobacteraceae bacterium]
MRKTAAALLLIATTFFWGITFTVVKDAVARVDVFVFLAQRFAVAAALMIFFGLLFYKLPRFATVRCGVTLGIALFSAYAFQTAALLYTTASNTGFLTGLNVVFVPILGALFFRHRIPVGVRWGVAIASIGLFLLCTGGELSINYGDILGFICAICVALHLLLTGHYAHQHNVYWITTIQMTTIAIASATIALAGGKPLFVYYPFLLWPLLLCAIFASVFAFLVQTAMQRHISAAQTALIFCLEPVFAAGYAYFAAGEKLSTVAWFGASLILVAMLIAELMPAGVITDKSILESTK